MLWQVSFCLALAGVVHSVLSSAALAQEVGDTVICIRDCSIMVGTEVLAQPQRGITLKVEEINGEWFWVSWKRAGYIHHEDVLTVDRAIDYFTEQIRRRPGDGGAHVARGNAWDEKGEHDIAIGDFHEAIRRDPGNAVAYGGLGIAWYRKGEYDKAIDNFGQSLRHGPDDAITYVNRGVVWATKGEYDRAIDDYDQAISLDPNYALAYNNRGNAWNDKGEYGKAIEDFCRAIRLNPKDAIPHNNRGLTWSYKGEYDRAIADYVKAIELNPKYASPYDNLAWLLATCPDEKYRDGKRAMRNAKKACDLSGWRKSSAISALAAAHAEAGDFDEAVKWQKKAVELAPEKWKDDHRSRLDLYQSGKPYREELQE